jgi:hypothetical protein
LFSFVFNIVSFCFYIDLFSNKIIFKIKKSKKKINKKKKSRSSVGAASPLTIRDRLVGKSTQLVELSPPQRLT